MVDFFKEKEETFSSSREGSIPLAVHSSSGQCLPVAWKNCRTLMLRLSTVLVTGHPAGPQAPGQVRRHTLRSILFLFCFNLQKKNSTDALCSFALGFHRKA